MAESPILNNYTREIVFHMEASTHNFVDAFFISATLFFMCAAHLQ